MLIKWRTPTRPLDPHQMSVWQSLIHHEEYMARAYETIALARRQLESARRVVPRPAPAAPHPHPHRRRSDRR